MRPTTTTFARGRASIVAMAQNQSLRVRDALDSYERITELRAAVAQPLVRRLAAPAHAHRALPARCPVRRGRVGRREAREFASKTNNWGHYPGRRGPDLSSLGEGGLRRGGSPPGNAGSALAISLPIWGSLGAAGFACAHALRAARRRGGRAPDAHGTGPRIRNPEPSFGPMTRSTVS